MMDDIDLYGDGLATELNVSQTSTSVQQLQQQQHLQPPPILPTKVEPQIKPEPVMMPAPLPLPPSTTLPPPAIKQEPAPAPAATAVPGVTYVTQDTFAKQNQYHYIDPSDPKSKTVYIGNLTWWTTDVDVQHACNSLNVRDVINIKFYENRSNGQSKGYCSVDLGSINSAKTLLHELRNVTIHNEHPYVAIASKTPLYYFETALGIKNDDKKKVSTPGPPPPPIGAIPGIPPLPLPGMPPGMPPAMPPPGMPGMPPPAMGMPGMPPPPGCPLPPPMPLPPPPMGITPMLPPPPDLTRPPVVFTPLPTSLPQMNPAAAAHVNPAFLPAAVKPTPQQGMSEQEKGDMVNKNHQVCKTAILRAYESCDAKDYDQAEGTVAAALKIIKMSAVSDDPKSKAFIADLEECLAYVQKRQKKSGKRSSERSGSHRRSDRSGTTKERRRSRSQDQEPVRERKREKRSERSGGGDRNENSRYDRSKDYEDYKELRRRELI